MLSEKVLQDLNDWYAKLRTEGKILPREQLQEQYAMFEERFGPERLSGLDGRNLLYTMHALGEDYRDSLVYWLEFKTDDEFQTKAYGNIAGGSAHKFGLYRRKEDSTWITGSPQHPIELSEEQAVEIAQRHREQLFRGIDLLQQLPEGAGPTDYRHLQKQIEVAAPDIYDSAWAHKYFFLLFPEKLDDYHVEYLQQFHLIKLLIEPPAGSGRYLSAGHFVSAAKELGWPMNHFTKVLNHRNGRNHNYWRVLVQYPDDERYKDVWPAMSKGGFIGISYNLLGDLSDIQHDQASKDELQKRMQKAGYAKNGGWSNDIFNFVARIQEGDIVLAFERSSVLGIGRVTGPYVYDTSLANSYHHRPVEWLSVGEWSLPEAEAVGRVARILKSPKNLVEIERRILESPEPGPVSKPIGRAARLVGIPGRIQTILDRKKQVILYGPPGTGKTYWARIAARELAAHRSFGKPFDDLGEEEKASIEALGTGNKPYVRMCTFHPAYGYEDFLEGYRPVTTDDQQLIFERQEGIFKRLCEDARARPDHNFYMVIDEINRGDIPRIFGELLTIIEKDKRDQAILLPLSGQAFSVPPNVYIIGTMNTADRSIALLDTALRRRFGFIELMPEYSVLGDAVVANMIPLGKWLEELNTRILSYIGRDSRNLQIGHAYLLEKGRPVIDTDRFVRILQDDIIPLLEEYCYEDYEALSNILGSTFVDREKQRIRHELFVADRRDDLLAALIKLWPELITSADVVAAEAVSEQLEEENDESEDLAG
jgi:5-methylcytosine-specific restriction protein B